MYQIHWIGKSDSYQKKTFNLSGESKFILGDYFSPPDPNTSKIQKKKKFIGGW